jgi:hypothetical protein
MNTTKSCQNCSAVSDLNLCPSCEGHLQEALGQLPGLLLELETTVTRQDKLYTVSGKTSDTPSPINWGSSALANEVEDLLIDMVDTMVQAGLKFFPARSVGTLFIGPLPLGWQRLPRGYSGSPEQRARWLAHHVHQIAKYPRAGEMYRKITDLTGDPNKPSKQGRLLRAIDRTVRIWAGPCPTMVARDREGQAIECARDLWAEDGMTEIVCPRCESEINIGRNRQRAIMSRDLLPEARLMEVMLDLEEPIYSDLLQKWLKSGQLKPAAYLSGARIVQQKTGGKDARLFSLSRVRQLRMAHQAEKERVAS